MNLSRTESKRIGDILSENMMFVVLLLLLAGLYMINDATAPRNSSHGGLSVHFFKQLTWSFLGISCFIGLIYAVPMKWIRESAPWLGLLVVLALAGVLVVGDEIKGARRWYRLGFASFQPSEMAKIFSLIFFAWYLDRHKEVLSHWFGMLPCMLLILMVVGLIAAEPDLGNAVLLFTVLVSMLYIAGARIRHLMILLAVTLPVFCVAMVTRFDHIRKRLEVFLNPEDHLSGGAYQNHQALIALGSGGFSGKGVGAGLQKLYYLPEAHNDFIFAIVGEDFGFLGCLVIVLLYSFLVWYAIQACIRSTHLFHLLLSYGITFIFAGQALFNICVVTGIVPNKGISLPLISYGGSNAIFTLIGLGILVKLTRKLPPENPLALGAYRLPKTNRLF